MYNKAKVQAFIRTLSEEEISSQISDLFAFMEEYKQFEDYQCDPVMCRDCGSYLFPSQKFCGKCGSNISQSE